MNKAQWLVYLNILLKLIENDRIEVSELDGKTPEEILVIAKANQSDLEDDFNRLDKLGE